MSRTRVAKPRNRRYSKPLQGADFAVNLPHPTPEGVKESARLYRLEFGVELEPTKALELATRTLQFVYLGTTKYPGASQKNREATEQS